MLAIIRRMGRHFKSKSCLDSAENKLTLRVHLDQMITTLIRIDLQFGVIFERVRDNESLCSTTNKLDGLIEKWIARLTNKHIMQVSSTNAVLLKAHNKALILEFNDAVTKSLIGSEYPDKASLVARCQAELNRRLVIMGRNSIEISKRNQSTVHVIFQMGKGLFKLHSDLSKV